MMQRLLDSFESHAQDRKSNIFKSAFSNIKLNKELNSSLEALPREMYESLKAIIFSDESKTQRYIKLKEIFDYFTLKDELEKQKEEQKNQINVIALEINANAKDHLSVQESLKEFSKKLDNLRLDEESMKRIEKLIEQYHAEAFIKVAKRHELGQQLKAFKILNPNLINEEIIREKKAYKSMIRDYLKNRLASRVEDYKREKQYRAALESIGRKLSKTKRAYKTFDSLKSNPFNFEAMSGIIPIWMMGLDDASRVLPLKQNLFDYVIIDEASQCNISYSLPAMYRSRHTIFFGDTLQMRDTTTAFKSNARLEALAQKHKIPEDLQIKASEDSVKSVMDIAKLSGFQTTVLRNHYRSPKELIGFSNEWFYEPRGRRLQVVNDDILAMEDGRVLKNHIVAINPTIELSEKTNITEAVYIKQLIADIKNNEQTKNKSIAVLAFFNEQAELLRRVILDDDVKISVIEGIQGDERDIVIYSFVIKSPQEKLRYIALTGESGEIRKEINEGRVNVAFSRARLQVHTVTSIAPNLWPEGIWIKRYLEYVETRGQVNRQVKIQQHFDSKFEENVYDFLFNNLDSASYTITTQVESCGFKIDLVIRSIESGKKLAIECDGPTHFEAGDGQVRVVNDYERQSVLETAGWRFYRIIYSEWLEDNESQRQEILDYIKIFMNQAEPIVAENNITNESVYIPLEVEIPTNLVESLKAAMKAQPSKNFGKQIQPKASESAESSSLETTEQQLSMGLTDTIESSAEKAQITVKKSIKKKNTNDFSKIDEIVLSPRRSIVVSSKPDGSIWVNEKLTTEAFEGFTSKGFGIAIKDFHQFIDALNIAITENRFEKDFVISSSLKLVIHNPDPKTVDIRYYKKTQGYTGYLKRGIRVTKPFAEKLRGILSAYIANLNSTQIRTLFLS